MSFSRRQFLLHSGGLALGTKVAASLPLNVFSSMAHAAGDYRAIVCVLLAGGCDSFNLLVPRSNAAYAQYQARRSDLALPQSDLLPLDGTHNGVSFGLHPALAALQARFNAGQASLITNIGPLVEPTDRAAYDNEQVVLPLGLFSHADQILSWQTATPADRSGSGFAGRLANALTGANTGLALAGNISLSGNNAFQTGATAGSYSINAANGVQAIGGYDNALVQQSLAQMLDVADASILRRVYSQKIQSAIDAGALFGAAIDSASALNTSFAADNFSVAMARIAQLISVREQLGVTRQTFFVTYGGWDHHDNTLAEQAEMLPALDAGLGQFLAATEELGVSQQVTTFTISDFGRTLTSNGKGSDHGWAGNALILGGAVQGGRLYGDFPEQVEDNPLDVGRGRFLPSTAVDTLYAEISRWMGVDEALLPEVLPNWPNFVGSTQGSGLDGLLAG